MTMTPENLMLRLVIVGHILGTPLLGHRCSPTLVPIQESTCLRPIPFPQQALFVIILILK